MTKDGVRRIATSHGAVLASDASLTAAAQPQFGAPIETLFRPAFWAARGELVEVSRGRGSAWFIGAGGTWVLRHSRRGGFIARLTKDRYLWAGEARVRVFAELRLLSELVARGLPVPTPIGARYVRGGIFYRCDLITERIASARPLSEILASGLLEESVWRAIGATIARLHAAGADHADLNAHNILLDAAGGVSVIDFDRGRLRAPSSAAAPASWCRRNLSRLQRSLAKIASALPPERYPANAWRWLSAAYAGAGAETAK